MASKLRGEEPPCIGHHEEPHCDGSYMAGVRRYNSPAMALLPPGVHSEFPTERDQLTPLFRQYLEIKDREPGALLLYRLGDFYETFGPDAVRLHELLGLTLTARGASKDYKVAMAGVPHHSAGKYIRQLVEAGEVVALCEQTQDPSEAKGLVERAVTRVITAGTLVEEEYLAEDSGNFLAVAVERNGSYGIALLESSGGQVELRELSVATGSAAHEAQAGLRRLADALLRQRPAELLLTEELHSAPGFQALLSRRGGNSFMAPALQRCPPLPRQSEITAYLHKQLAASQLAGLGLERHPAAAAALYALLRYLAENFRLESPAVYPRFCADSAVLYLDERAVSHLDLLPPADGSRSLYSLLNRCKSSAGRRELKRALLAPLADYTELSLRHDSVERLLGDRALAESIAALLAALCDIERVSQRAALDKSNPREIRSLGESLSPLMELRALCLASNEPLLSRLAAAIADFSALAGYLLSALAEDAPAKSGEPGVIRQGFDSRVDELALLLSGGGEWFRRYEESERERTGIRSLKVKQTGPFGWFIEVSKANSTLVPADYRRRQTLVNAERFTTDKLTHMEGETGSALSRLLSRERELYSHCLQRVREAGSQLAMAARAAAEIDVLQSLAEIAREKGWQRAQLIAPAGLAGSSTLRLELTGARHPLIEEAVGGAYYTANDCWLDGEGQQIMVITGPNMGGKSTYLRMVAMLAVMNQLGSFLPAASAALPLFSRVYTRVGAEDRQSRGQSTFMVEMLETAEILQSLSGPSLILLDEVGRGTSTYDGISIAKAVLEFLHEHPWRPLTLFATHFFELTDLELALPRAKNFSVEVARESGSFVFLYRVSPGAASDSFGIEVAALAGLPAEVLARARHILAELEEAKDLARERARRAVQLGLFGE